MPSAEGECKCPHTGSEEFYPEGSIFNAHTALLPNQLIQAAAGHYPATVRVSVHAVIRAGRFPVKRNAEANRLSVAAQPKNGRTGRMHGLRMVRTPPR